MVWANQLAHINADYLPIDMQELFGKIQDGCSRLNETTPEERSQIAHDILELYTRYQIRFGEDRLRRSPSQHAREDHAFIELLGRGAGAVGGSRGDPPGEYFELEELLAELRRR